MTTKPKNDGRKADGTFAPGNKANPNGKPKGTKHHATRAVEALLEGEAEALTRKAVERALEGDVAALRLCIERLAPPAKGRRIALDLPPIKTAQDISDGQSAVIGAMASGEVSPDEASVIAGVLEARRRAIETVELEARIKAIEERTEK